MAGPGDNAAAGQTRGRGRLRASQADREQVIGTLKDAFVEGRLTVDELDARVDQVYASRTYAELAEVTADIPAGLAGARPPRDPWRATKTAWVAVYALILPGLITLAALPGGPPPPSQRWSPTPRSSTPCSGFSACPWWSPPVSVSAPVGNRRRGQRQVSAGKVPVMLPLHRTWGRPLMTEPGNDLAVDAGRDDLFPVYRWQVTSTLKAALGQGRLTEDEYDERVGQAAASQSRAELAALIADLPVGLLGRPPTARMSG